MKFPKLVNKDYCTRSLPSLGAWIEVVTDMAIMFKELGRSLRWERGLKFLLRKFFTLGLLSLPSLGAWIEVTPSIPS